MSDIVFSPHLILTVTPNPSLDLLFESNVLVWDDANRLPDPRRRPGGQGVNVARAVRALGAPAAAAVLAGGRTGTDIVAALEREDIIVRASYAQEETRTFVAARERDTGHSMLLNARGPARSAGEVAAFVSVVERAISELHPAWVACCGSLPQGFPDEFYLTIAETAHAVGARVVIDCDGASLRIGASACDLLVPNQHEAARLAGVTIGDVESARHAANVLREMTHARIVAITLGARGAVAANSDGCWHVQPPTMTQGSAVGAGDAFLAGLITALESGAHIADALRSAVATGTATLLSKGAGLVDAADVARLREQVIVTQMQSASGV